jgi:hypothetical protein
MKKNEFLTILASLALSILVAWLQLILGTQIYSFVLLVMGALLLSFLVPGKSWLVALILVAGSPLLYSVWVGLHLSPRDPFSWMSDVILPGVLVLPSTVLGTAIGWMHNIVKDDF